MKEQNLITKIFIVGSIVVVSFLAFQIGQKWLKNNAIDMCLSIGKVETNSSSNKFTQPMKEWYLFCMREKGYK